MKSLSQKHIVAIAPPILIFLFIVTISLMNTSCTPKAVTRNKLVLKVDMSKEHDTGKFEPGKGDKVYVAGNFNGWKKYQIMLIDKKGNWIYSANVAKYFKQTENGLPIDTLSFNFLIKPGTDRPIPNQGWEQLAARKMAVSELISRSPIFRYGKAFDNKEPFDVTFTVGMDNEKTLGFFEPRRGDQVVVSGSFCDWSSKGVPLNSEGGGIYSRKVRIWQNPKHPLEYSFRIIPKGNAVEPNYGWETIPMRRAALDEPSITLPYANFDNIRRVAKFVINTNKWQRKGEFKPMKGDILQIRLLLDGKKSLSDALFQVNKYRFETAIAIPLTVSKVKWQVVENMKLALTPVKRVDVGLNGAIIRN